MSGCTIPCWVCGKDIYTDFTESHNERRCEDCMELLSRIDLESHPKIIALEERLYRIEVKLGLIDEE